MKALKTIAKIVAALAAIAGIVYVVATYGEKIVAWAKKMLNSCPLCNCKKDFVPADGAAQAPAEEADAAPAEEAAAEEAPAPENTPVAEESDFEG